MSSVVKTSSQPSIEIHSHSRASHTCLMGYSYFAIKSEQTVWRTDVMRTFI